MSYINLHFTYLLTYLLSYFGVLYEVEDPDSLNPLTHSYATIMGRQRTRHRPRLHMSVKLSTHQ